MNKSYIYLKKVSKPNLQNCKFRGKKIVYNKNVIKCDKIMSYTIQRGELHKKLPLGSFFLFN
ncbi:hypothetical protein OSSY52_10750 [Tepiditoga spiralis]|uniref:Uncharacterized protein n=1 Tax=Tepiditoga spiralis TaxID=2108365 RepID=A0A7G1G701_9BACT|nr:hypothetical protein OSSY52_10750 [Tepiditoga spiralis]